MHCKEVEAVLEQEGLQSLSEAALEHMTDCSACQNLFSDLTEIVTVAGKLPAAVDPPDRVWISLHAQLEAEGIIKSPRAPEERPVWWQHLPELFGSRGLVAAVVGLLLVAALTVQLRRQPAGHVQSPVEQQASSPAADSLEPTSQILRQAEWDLSNMRQAGTSPSRQDSSSPAHDSLQTNLKAVDEFIVQCEQHLRQDPQDQLAREYLSRAYQQKAELLSALLDSGRSEN
ncbi:MAG: hypothetical protein PVS2B2_09720 [Candidatus Acidiferrum sp.]